MYDSEDLPLTELDYDVWAKGLRNPFRLDIDRQTGDIYLGDVGDSTAEVCRHNASIVYSRTYTNILFSGIYPTLPIVFTTARH